MCNVSENTELKEFLKSVKRVNEHRVHKVKNSYGVYDGFKFYRKNRPDGHEYVLTESQYFAIVRKVNQLLGQSLIEGNDITFPYRMGRIEIRKNKAKITLDGNKIKTNLPIDWDRTVRLWYEDQESYKNKTLIKIEEKEIYKVYYNRTIADYTNKSFYKFTVNRALKNNLKKNIKEGKIDAFLLKKE